MSTTPTHPWAHLTEEEKQRVAVQLRERLARAGVATNRTDSPLDLARRHDREVRVRPHVTAMNEHLTWLEETPDARLMIFSPPQVGKSFLVGQKLPEWWLTRHPRDRVVIASYGLSTATKSGVVVRDWMRDHGHEYGLHPTTEWNRERWTLTSGGGMKSVGIGGRLTSESMDLGIIDDPHKDRLEAKSETRRTTVWEWYSAVFGTRRQPGTRELLVMTRWHPDDLAGRLLKEYGRIEEGGAWRVLHMPALALATDLDRGIYPDPLGRQPGEPLSHPKIKDGDTRALAKFWAGEKANRIASDWDAMYLTIPFASDGALLTDEDMKNAIVERAPATIRTIVSVDPSGEGRDEAGIVAGQLDAEQQVTITHDATGQYTVIGWSERVCKLAHKVDADGIVVEKNFGGAMGRVIIQQAWENLQRLGKIPTEALCPAIYEVHARKSKVLRAEPVAQAIKTGRVKFLRGTQSESGDRHLRLLRTQWTMWTPGSTYSPGALDACVHLARFLLPPVAQGAEASSLVEVSRSTLAGEAVQGLRIAR